MLFWFCLIYLSVQLPPVASDTTRADSHDAAQRFTLWALETLRCQLRGQDNGVFHVWLPEDLREDWNGSEILDLTFAPDDNRHSEPATTTSRLFQWVVDRLQQSGELAHAAPAVQPAGVHQFSSQLFSAYTFDGGRIHLAGCTLDDRPLLRLTYRRSGEDEHHQRPLRHLYYSRDTQRLNDETVESLKLSELAVWEGKPPELDESQKRTWLTMAQHRAEEQLAGTPHELVAATLVWCKYAAGKLAFEADENTVYVSFEGWVTCLADGKTKPPPYHCPISGINSYHLATTDDGRILPAEAIAVCQQSGRRAPQVELQTCGATGRTAMPELLATCPVTDQRVIKTQLLTCQQCGQQVSPAVVSGGRCATCRTLAKVSKDDARLARILGEYPRLDRWPRWKFGEAKPYYVLVARSWFSQLLLVIDKESLEVTRAATAGTLLGGWQELEDAQREDVLG